MDFNAWLGDTTFLTAADRAVDTARLIADKPSSITVRRAGAALAAQTVRLEPINSTPSNRRGEIADTSTIKMLIIGYRDHATIADTNVQRGDRFFFDGQMYSVLQVMTGVPSRLLAIAEASE